MKVCVAGGAGFIGSHLAKKLKELGHYVIVADIQKNIYFEQYEFCDEFHQVDLRYLDNCISVTKDCDQVYNLSCLMGGMGFISLNQATILYINTMISFNMLEAARINNVSRYFYSSSACIYPNYKQLNEQNLGLAEDDAWPAEPQDSYGLEKLCTEELCMHYDNEFNIKVRIGRFHNIYGPYGTWFGGKEKSPAAFARKVLVATDSVEVWGDGEQTRTYCYIDDCIDAILLLMNSDYNKPLNIGSDYLVSINSLALLALTLVDKPDIKLNHIKGPLGVRGRSSDNTLVKKILNWEPKVSLEEGMKKTIEWIRSQLDDYEGDEDFKISQVSEKVTPDTAYGLR